MIATKPFKPGCEPMQDVVKYYSATGVGGAPVVVTPTTPLPVSVVSGGVSSVPLGYQQINGLVASTALTVPAGSTYAIIMTEGQAVRWRDDGTAPTAGVGMPLSPGQVLKYDGSLAAIRFIQQAATATLNIAYYR